MVSLAVVGQQSVHHTPGHTHTPSFSASGMGSPPPPPTPPHTVGGNDVFRLKKMAVGGDNLANDKFFVSILLF